MRDPKRIDSILEKIGKLWKMFPDLRFFQLIGIIKFDYKGSLFYLEDNQLLKSLEQTIKDYSKKD